MHQNCGNIDATLKNFSEMSAKLNQSADKVDGVLTSAQSFLGSPGTKGAVDRISEAALSVKKLADDVDVRVKDIATGLSRFTNTGLREYEALAIQGRRADRRHRPRGAFARAESKSGHLRVETLVA